LPAVARRAGIRLIRKVFESVTGLLDRLKMLEKIGPPRNRPCHVRASFGLGHRPVWLELIVDHHDLDIAAGHLAAEILDREREAVANLLAERRAGRQGHDHADLDFSCATACPAERLNRAANPPTSLMFMTSSP